MFNPKIINKIIIAFLFFLFSFSAYADDPDSKADPYITLNFQDISVRSALQLLANFSKTDIVVNDSVKGNMSLHLNHVHWEEALKVILKTRGLDSREVNGVIFVAPADEITNWDKTSEASVELLMESIAIQYARAEDIAKTLKDTENSLLSPRGNISVDKRMNMLLVYDTPEKILLIKNVLQSLDQPVRQVLIEARIVSVNRDFEKDIGIQFGISKENHLSGTLDGANAMAGGTTASAVPVTQRLNLDLAATSSAGASPASIGLALAKLGGGILLDLELSALESQGEGKVISSPRLVTANQQSAFIESGEEIPYQEATSSGATSVTFKKAVLRLKVTPQITPNDKIMMALNINQDMPNGILINGVPEVTTKEIQTNVLVNNGETLVLGGIYRQDKTHITQRVPFLSDLPGIGSIFQKKTDKISYEELLIFITPKIINEEI